MATINVQGLQAGAPDRTTGTEGRNSVPAFDLSAVADVVQAAGSAQRRSKAGEAKAERDAAANEFERAALEVKIGVATGDFDLVTRAATDFKEETGRDMTDAERGQLSQFQALQQSTRRAIEQGKPELAANISLMVLQRRILAKYPHLEPEIAKMNNPDQFNKTTDLAYEEEKGVRERKEAALKRRDETLQAQGYDITQIGEAEKAAVYMRVQRDVQSIEVLNRRGKELEAEDKITAAEKGRIIQREAEAMTPSLGRILFTEVSMQMQKGRDPAERAALGRQALANMRRQLGKTLGGGNFTADPKAVDEKFGYLFDAAGADIDKLAADPSEARLKEFETAQKLRLGLMEESFYAANPGAQTFQMLSKVLTPQGMQMLSSSPTLQNMGATFVFNAARSLGVDPTKDTMLRDVTNGMGIQADQATITEGARKASAGAAAAYALPDSPGSQPLKQGAAIEALSFLASPAANRGADYKPLRSILPAVSNPAFVAALGGKPVPMEAKTPVYGFTNSAGAAAQSIVGQLQSSGSTVTLDQSALSKGTVRFVVSGKTESDPTVRKLRQAERDMTDGIKASAHLDGRTDYPQYFTEFGWR